MTTDIISPLPAAAPPPPTPPKGVCVGVDVEIVKQAELTWCWAAVGVCLLDRFDRNVGSLDQCGVAHKLDQNCVAPCADRTCLRTQDVANVFQVLGLQAHPFSFANALEKSLASGDVIVSVVAVGSDTHLVVVHHFCPDSNQVLVMDPKQDWDTHQSDLTNFLRREIGSLYLAAADNPSSKKPVPFATSLKAVAGKKRAARMAVRSAVPSPHLSAGSALALTRPAAPSSLLADKLASIHAPGVAASSSKTGIWFPRLCWSSRDVRAKDFSVTHFLGWREILETDGQPVAVVDTVPATSGGDPVFEKVSTGKAAKGISDALDQLAARGIDLNGVTMLAVPCLAIHMLQYEVAGVPKLATAFSIWPEFAGEMDEAGFVTKAQARAVLEQVTAQV